MKKMIAVALLASFVAYSPAVFATTSNEEGKESSKEVILNKFKDNWMISIEGGANFSMGLNDSQPKFGNRIAPVFGINVEKWFAPAIGLRLGVDYYGYKGATADFGAHGVSGEMFSNENGDFYRQSFGMVYPALDVMSDLASLFCGYRDRVYSPIIYVGAGIPVAVRGDGEYANWANFGLRAGLLNRFRVAEGWAINLDIRVDGTEARVPGETDHGTQLSALLGVTYKFKNRGWKNVKYPEAVGDALVAEVESLKQDKVGLNNEIDDLERQLKEAEEALRNQKAQVVEVVKEQEAQAQAVVEPAVTVYYTIGSTELNSKDRKVLRAIAEVIKANEDAKYVVTGYADAETGTSTRNAQLRDERAQSVIDALVAYGVDGDQLVKEVNEKGFGLGSNVLDRAATIVEQK